MALRAKVTNSGEVDLGRDYKLFPAGSEETYDISGPQGLIEISSHPDLAVEVVETQTNVPIPKDVPVSENVVVTDPVSGQGEITPAAAKYAREKDVDLAYVQGTGADGRVLMSDVERYLTETTPAEPPDESVNPQPNVQPNIPPEGQV